MSFNIKTQTILFSIIILFFACKKEENNSDPIVAVNNTVPPPKTWQAFPFMSNLLPLLGSCVDSTGNLLFFQVPFLDSVSFDKVNISGKILQANNPNYYSTFFDFQNQTFAYGEYNGSVYNGQAGRIPGGVNVSLAMTKDGTLYMATNRGHSLYIVYRDYLALYKNIEGIIAVSSFDNSLYIATSPLYDYSGNTIQQPRIYEINQGGVPSLYYEFSPSIKFNRYTGRAGGYDVTYPMGYSVSLKMGKDSNMYIAFGYDDIIYKIDKTKNLSIYITDIPYPTSIDIDNNNRMYVASAPGFEVDSLYNRTMNKPVEVYSVFKGISSKIYAGNLFTPKHDGSYSEEDKLKRSSVSFYSLSISRKNELFLVSPEGNITLIK